MRLAFIPRTTTLGLGREPNNVVINPRVGIRGDGRVQRSQSSPEQKIKQKYRLMIEAVCNGHNAALKIIRQQQRNKKSFFAASSCRAKWIEHKKKRLCVKKKKKPDQ